MQHNLSIEGYGIRLRPVLLEDAADIIRLRTADHAVGRLSDTDRDEELQKQWLRTYYEREGDYYFMVEDMTGASIGTVGIYDVHENVGETGRWVMGPSTFASVACVLLLYRLAFEVLVLERIVFSVLSDNYQVISFNRRSGARTVRIERNAREVAGVWKDFVWFEITRDDWPQISLRLELLANAACKALRHHGGKIAPHETAEG